MRVVVRSALVAATSTSIDDWLCAVSNHRSGEYDHFGHAVRWMMAACTVRPCSMQASSWRLHPRARSARRASSVARPPGNSSRQSIKSTRQSIKSEQPAINSARQSEGSSRVYRGAASFCAFCCSWWSCVFSHLYGCRPPEIGSLLPASAIQLARDRHTLLRSAELNPTEFSLDVAGRRNASCNMPRDLCVNTHDAGSIDQQNSRHREIHP